MKSIKLLTLLILLQLNSIAQDQNNDISLEDEIALGESRIDFGLLGGLSFNNSLFGEIGIYAGHVESLLGMELHSRYLNLGMEFSKFNSIYLAPKLSARFNLGVTLGATVINYFDLNGKSSLKARPEVGLGFSRFEVLYGYNFNVMDNGISHLNTHNFNIKFYLKLKEYNVNSDNYKLTE